jgi:hypothetical protein
MSDIYRLESKSATHFGRTPTGSELGSGSYFVSTDPGTGAVDARCPGALLQSEQRTRDARSGLQSLTNLSTRSAVKVVVHFEEFDKI